MGLNEANKRRLDKKLLELKKAQVVAKADDIKRLDIEKEGDAKWERYKKKALKRLDNYYAVELRRYHAMMYRAYLDDQKGKKPSPHINL